MTSIDPSVHTVPAASGLVAPLATVVAGIGSSVDDEKRAEMQSWAQCVGAWWVGRARGGAPLTLHSPGQSRGAAAAAGLRPVARASETGLAGKRE